MFVGLTMKIKSYILLEVLPFLGGGPQSNSLGTVRPDLGGQTAC